MRGRMKGDPATPKINFALEEKEGYEARIKVIGIGGGSFHSGYSGWDQNQYQGGGEDKEGVRMCSSLIGQGRRDIRGSGDRGEETAGDQPEVIGGDNPAPG